MTAGAVLNGGAPAWIAHRTTDAATARSGRWHGDRMDNCELALESLIFACDTGALGQDNTRLSRAAQRGILVRVKQGVYLRRSLWDALTPIERHRVRLFMAERLGGPGLVFSHASAAALLGLPILGRWPEKAHVLRDCAAGGRSTTGLARHALGLDGVPLVTVNGLTVTAPSRTVIDLAVTMPFDSAVVSADAAQRVDRRTRHSLTTPEEVRALLAGMMPFRGMRRAQTVLDASTTQSDSVGETLCRIILAELGFASPELQAEFSDAEGLIGYADFTWRHARVILEFDGLGKYSDERYSHGRSPAQIVILEKKREDRLRDLGFRVIRVYWDDLRDPARLLRLLLEAGLQPLRTVREIRRPWL